MEDSVLTLVILPIALFIIMLGMGLSLVVDDFKRIALYPKATLIGLTNQLILLPIIAFSIITLLNLPPMVAVGFMLLAACPGGTTSNLITFVSRGDTALSITLTAISSFVSVVTIPFIVSSALDYFVGTAQTIELPVLKTIIQILAITVFPVSIGMAIRRFSPDFAERMDKPMRTFSTVTFLLILLSIIATNLETIQRYLLEFGGVSLLLNILTMALGFFSAKFFKLNVPQSVSISIESGIQNSTLAIVIATNILLQSDLALPAAIYGLTMFLPGGFMMWYFGRKKRAPQKALN
ncbi:MAG: bile acid:sodium symporter family protein [Bacteroidota bacterium]